MRIIDRYQEQDWPSTTSKFELGGYCEGADWEIIGNSLEYLWGPACPHATEILIRRIYRGDGTYFDNEFAVVPRVIQGHNEGGYNVTRICLDCVIEAARGL